MKRTSGVALAGLAFASCSSPKLTAYQNLAGELNPILIPLAAKLSALVVLERDAAHHGESIYAVCTSADPELAKIGGVAFDSALRLEIRDQGLSFEARSFAQRRYSLCEPAEKRADGLGCATFCLAGWESLSKGLERIRVLAAAEGVAIYGVPEVASPWPARHSPLP